MVKFHNPKNWHRHVYQPLISWGGDDLYGYDWTLLWKGYWVGFGWETDPFFEDLFVEILWLGWFSIELEKYTDLGKEYGWKKP